MLASRPAASLCTGTTTSTSKVASWRAPRGRGRSERPARWQGASALPGWAGTARAAVSIRLPLVTSAAEVDSPSDGALPSPSPGYGPAVARRMGQKHQIRGLNRASGVPPGQDFNVTVTWRVVGDRVTVPVASSTEPVEAEAMCPTNDGSSKRTGPAGRAPRRLRVTDEPLDVMVRSARRPPGGGEVV